MALRRVGAVARVEGGKRSWQGPNVRFDMSIAESRHSGIGQARPTRLQLLMSALGHERPNALDQVARPLSTLSGHS